MKKTIIFMTVLTVTLFAFMACANPAGGDGGGGGPLTINDASKRYLVTPVDNDGKDYDVEYAYTDGMYDYYLIYLGSVAGVPVSAQDTQRYNGTTPITLTYTSTVEDETSITDQNEENVTLTTERAIDMENEFNISYMHESGVAFGPATTKGTIELGYRFLLNTHNSSGESRSTTNTHTSFESWKQSSSKEISFTIGEHGEPEGYYRLALFSSSDVYATIIKDKNTGDYYYEYNNFARSNTFFTAIDYAGDINDFNERGNAAKLTIDEGILPTLPEPELMENTELAVHNFSDRTDQNVGEITIPAEKNIVAFSGNPDVVFTMNIKIAPRNKDLTLMFNNMRFGTYDETDALYDADTSSAAHTINLVLSGTNEINGGGGKPGSRNWTNITNATGGKAGINVGANTLHVSGAGSLMVTGGRGGDGTPYKNSGWVDFLGKMRESFDTWGHTSATQNSPNGGTGGVGIAGGDLNFNDSSGLIRVTGGEGGEAGFSYFIDEIWDLGYEIEGLYFWYGANGKGGNGIAGILSDSARTAPITLSGGKAGNLDINAVKAKIRNQISSSPAHYIDEDPIVVDAPTAYERGDYHRVLDQAPPYVAGGQNGARGDGK